MPAKAEPELKIHESPANTLATLETMEKVEEVKQPEESKVPTNQAIDQMPKSPRELQKMVGVLKDDSEDLFDIRKSSADPYVPKKISSVRNELVMLTLCFRENKAPGAKQ